MPTLPSRMFPYPKHCHSFSILAPPSWPVKPVLKTTTLRGVTLRFGAGRGIAALPKNGLPSSLIDQRVPRLVTHLVQDADDATHLLRDGGLGLPLSLAGLPQLSDDPQLAQEACQLQEVLGGFDLCRRQPSEPHLSPVESRHRYAEDTHQALRLDVHGHVAVGCLTRRRRAADGFGGQEDEVAEVCEYAGNQTLLAICGPGC